MKTAAEVGEMGILTVEKIRRQCAAQFSQPHEGNLPKKDHCLLITVAMDIFPDSLGILCTVVINRHSDDNLSF